MNNKKMKIMKTVFTILILVLILEVTLIAVRKNKEKKYESYNDCELTAFLIKTYSIFETTYTEEELSKYEVEKQLDLIKDEYAKYLTEEKYEKQMNELERRFVGLGFHSVEISDDYFEILEVLPFSPIAEAGLVKGDRIVKIDGKSINDMGIKNAINILEEKECKESVFTIQRDNRVFDVCIKRRLIKGKSVLSEMIDDSIGYLKIYKFSNSLGDEFINELSHLVNNNMTKLILDLRGNPGGEVNQIVPIASSLLCKKVKDLFSITYKKGEVKTFSRDRTPIFLGPLVVLCNEETASASEMLISILKDNDRCVTVGKKTYGKQYSQETFTLNSNNSLILSTGLPLSKTKRIWHKKGIEVDYDIANDIKGEDSQMKKAIEILKG